MESSVHVPEIYDEIEVQKVKAGDETYLNGRLVTYDQLLSLYGAEYLAIMLGVVVVNG